MVDQWLAAGPAVGEMQGAGGGLAGIRTSPGTRVLRVSGKGVSVWVAGDSPATQQDLRGTLAAVQEGRWEELTVWPGSYWVIADNGRHRFVCGDLAGIRPVYYTPSGRWATDVRELGVRLVPDLALAAARITAGEHWPGRSPYMGIALVPGGYGLLLTPGASPRLADVSAITPVSDLHVGAARFGLALTEAVEHRVSVATETVGADLSGGLDSSTAALLANRVGAVHAVTYTDGYTSAEDASFATRVAQHAGLRHTVARGTTATLPFGFPPDQPTGLEPALGAAIYAIDRAYLAPVAGLPLHLTGHGGDVVLDATSAAWVRLLQDGRRREAHRHVVEFARLRNIAPGPYWKQLRHTAALGRPGALDEAATRLEKNRLQPGPPAAGWSWCRLGTAAPWLTADGRAEVAALLRQAAADPLSPQQADIHDEWSALRLSGASAHAWSPYADALRVRPVHPYLDNTVVRAAFAVPALARRGLYVFKPLLAAALPDLPGWLLGRRSKGSFTPQRIAAFQQHQGRLTDLLAVSPLATAGLINSDAATSTLQHVAEGRSATGIGELHHLLVTSWWLTGQTRPTEAAC
ncbi:asparagine synthase-related protein [Streptomyces sp. NPDC094049]|uniref:asparagine synthase-related protein n=1 Tax=Streptomyces sp. NPDC094049 TaxID=3154987 RepID=UPI003318AE8B